MTPRVVFHIDAVGNVEVYADGDVEVITAYDVVPGDRLYRHDPQPIPQGLLDGPIGHPGDGHPGEARVARAVREAFGLPLMDVVGDGEPGR